MAGKTLDIDVVSYPTSVPDYVGSYIVESLLYGIYTVLFSFCVYLLLNRRGSKWPFLAVVVTLFAITTADTGMTMHYAFVYVLRGNRPPAYHAYPKYIFYITNNAIADSILVYRCYVVWHYNKLVIMMSGAVLLITTMCGYAFMISPSQHIGDLLPLYLWMMFALNLFLAVLIAGKILGNARRVRSILGSGTTARCYPFSAIIIESGAIYLIYMLLDLLVPLIFFDAGLIQVVGIVPTLIIIRIGLGEYIRDIETTTTLRSAEMRQSSTPVLDSIFSTVETTAATELPTSFDDNAPISLCVESSSAV